MGNRARRTRAARRIAREGGTFADLTGLTVDEALAVKPVCPDCGQEGSWVTDPGIIFDRLGIDLAELSALPATARPWICGCGSGGISTLVITPPGP
ncbi:MAG: hypothetical protein H5T81_11860 [Tetrasphaera sp.]|nr:hypothetical protein [Tetrasphaera sp.]